MTRKQKIAFVRALCRAVAKGVIADVPLMPEEWDGNELRALLADRFAQAKMTVGTKDPHYKKLTRAFRNACLERGL